MSMQDKLRILQEKASTMIRYTKKEDVVVAKVTDAKSGAIDPDPDENHGGLKKSSYGQRPNISGVDINADKFLMTNDDVSRELLENPPSLQHGMDCDTERELRFLACELIQKCAVLLKLPQTAAATAQILFHRFYYRKSFVKYDFEHTLMGCLMLASKIEEAPRRTRDVLNVFDRLYKINEIRRQGKPTNMETIALAKLKPMQLDGKYVTLKNNVIKAERHVLNTLGFVVHVRHPHKLIISYVHVMKLPNERVKEVIQRAWNYMNDGLRTDMFLRFTPETIACACIFMACRTIDNPIALPTEPFFWSEVFGASDRDVTTISLMLMKMYARKKAVDWIRLANKVHELKNKMDAENNAKRAEQVAAMLAAAHKRDEEEAAKDSREGSIAVEEVRGEKDGRKKRGDERERRRSRSGSVSRRKSPHRRRRDRDSPERNGRKGGERERERYRKDERKEERRRDENRDSRRSGNERRRSRSRDRVDKYGKMQDRLRAKEVTAHLGKRGNRDSEGEPAGKVRR